jgi:ADP-ribosylglycohydrolase
MAGLIVGSVQGRSKAELLAEHFSPVPGIWHRAPLAPKIANIAAGSFKRKQPPEVRGTGYVVDALEAALWAFHGTTSFRDGALLAVNLGHDADTTGAIYGQLAGVFYGVEAIPKSWRDRLTQRALIEKLATGLLETRK